MVIPITESLQVTIKIMVKFTKNICGGVNFQYIYRIYCYFYFIIFLFIIGKNVFTMLEYNKYNNYKNQQQKSHSLNWVNLNRDLAWLHLQQPEVYLSLVFFRISS